MKQLITLLALVWLSGAPLFSQGLEKLKVKGQYENKSLDLVFLELKINYDLAFEYDRKVLQGYRVSASFGAIPLENAMKIILQGTDLDFGFRGQTVLIFKKSADIAQADHPSDELPTRKNFTLAGIIKDKNTGETLPFATVTVQGAPYSGSNANADGYFTLFDVPSDTSVLLVSYIGYQTKAFRLHPAMDIQNLVVQMEDFGVQLQEILVEAEKKEQLIKASTGVSQIGIAPAALAKLPSFGERDIFRSLQLLPGISGSNESSSGLYVRGGTPDQNLVLFDGFTVYHVDHLFGFFSAFNANAVKDVQLFKGGFESKYGGRISSVVDLTGKDGNSEALNVGVGLSLLSVNGFAETPFAKGKGSVLVAGRRSFQSNFYNDIFEAFTRNSTRPANSPPVFAGRRGLPQQDVQPNTYFYDLNAKVSFRPNPSELISLSFYNGQDDLDNTRSADNSSFQGRPGPLGQAFNFVRESTDLTQWGNWGASLAWSKRFTDRWYANANLSYSNYYSERERGDKTTITRSDSLVVQNNGSRENNDLRDVTFKLDNEYKLHSRNQLEFGLQTSYQDIDYSFILNDTLDVLNRQDHGLTAAGYLQDKWTLSNNLILRGGLRTTYYAPLKKVYLEPRASFTYVLNDKIKLKAAFGHYYQFATRILREDIQQGSRDFWLLANGDQVPVSSAYHLIAGGSYETNTLLFDAEAYYKPMDGLSEYTTRFQPAGFGPERRLNYTEFFYHGKGTAKGIDFLLQKKVGKLTGWISYTLGQVKYEFPIYGSAPFYANQDQTHETKLVASYKAGKFTFSGVFIYATGKPYTAPTGYYEIELLNGSTTDFFEVSGKNALRLPDYHRVDLSAYYDFRLGQNKASAGLSLFNIYNRKNVWYKEYQVIEGELLETNVSLLGFTPSLFLNWSLR